jgi:nitrogen fixation NifU-like protein
MSYTEKVISHFKSPHNMGKMANPDGAGEVGNPVCGDLMNIYIKVAKNKKGQEIIKDIKFETLGCVAAIATSSMVTEMAKGKTLDEALDIKYSDVAEALGSLPPVKTHCADLAVKGLKAAIEDYRGLAKKSEP